MCMSARRTQPVTRREMQAARHFLEANVRADDPRLRHSLLESLGWLLMRMRNSLRPLLKQGPGDSPANAPLLEAARFLGDLHRFVLRGLLPGCNYQRRVTCLGVLRLLVCYLAPAPAGVPAGSLMKGLTQDPMPRSEVLRRHLRLGSVLSQRVLFNCIMDAVEDVRSKAADILAILPEEERPEGGSEDEEWVSAMAMDVPWRGVTPLEWQLALYDGCSCFLLQHLPSWEYAISLCNSQRFFQAESGALLASVLSSRGGE